MNDRTWEQKKKNVACDTLGHCNDTKSNQANANRLRLATGVNVCFVREYYDSATTKCTPMMLSPPPPIARAPVLMFHTQSTITSKLNLRTCLCFIQTDTLRGVVRIHARVTHRQPLTALSPPKKRLGGRAQCCHLHLLILATASIHLIKQ